MDQTEKLYEQLKKAEQEKQDVLSILHSYRHICGEHTPDELSRLVQADEDGRCLVAPFKIGQTVKHKTENWIGQVNEIAWNDEGLMLFVSSGGYTGYYPPGAFEKAVDSSEADSTALLKMYKAPQLPEGNLLTDSNEEDARKAAQPATIQRALSSIVHCPEFAPRPLKHCWPKSKKRRDRGCLTFRVVDALINPKNR